MSYAGGELLNNVFGISKILAIAIMTTIVTIYSFYGGIRATIQTDAIQFVHFAILIPLLAILIIVGEGFSWSEYQVQMGSQTEFVYDSSTFSLIFGTLVLYLFAQIGLDGSTLNRFLAARDQQVARKATIMAGLFISIWIALMIFIGSMAAYLYPDMANSDQILLFVAEKHFHGIFYGIFIIAMIGVVMSTQDTLLNGAGVSFSQDILQPLIPSLTDDKKLLYSKVYTIALGLVAIGIAGFLDSILDVIMTQLEYYIPVMTPIVIFSVVKKRLHWQAAIAGMLGGFISFILWRIFGYTAIPTLAFALLCNVLTYLLVDGYCRRKSIS